MAPENNIWGQMGYVPPRGACNHKESLLSAKCSCLRFMIHPLKASTSFDCDGCNHHASFHSMENPAENEVIKRWQAMERERKDSAVETGSKKRPRRAIENGTTAGSIIIGDENTAASTTSRATRRPASRKKPGNSLSQTAQLIEELDEVVNANGRGMLGYFTRR